MAHVVESTVGSGRPDLHRNGFGEEPVSRLARLGVGAGPLALSEQTLNLEASLHRRGNVSSVRDDPHALAVCLDERLVDEIEVDLLDRPSRLLLEGDGDLAADVRLAGAVHPVEELDEPLVAHLGERLGHRLPNDHTVADELEIGVVDELEHVVLATEHSEKRRRLGEDPAQPPLRALGGGPSGFCFTLGEDTLRGLGRDVQKGDDAAVVFADRAHRIGEPGFTRWTARPLHDEARILAEHRHTTMQNGVEVAGDDGPDLGPHLSAGTAEGARMLCAERRAIRIVVDEDELRPTPQVHRERRLEHGAHRDAQRRRPLSRWPEGIGCPIEGATASRHFPISGKQRPEIGRGSRVGRHVP